MLMHDKDTRPPPPSHFPCPNSGVFSNDDIRKEMLVRFLKKRCARAQLKAHEFAELIFGNLQAVLHVFDDDPA
ncbi:MAG: hypothetical protein COB53_04300 [Elusimicrobia bacterium]|nr:MAG: hypothetical protein COB53_04300 [Elusimicrobiota bacterium]